jgi:hypothetical protein
MCVFFWGKMLSIWRYRAERMEKTVRESLLTKLQFFSSIKLKCGKNVCLQSLIRVQFHYQIKFLMTLLAVFRHETDIENWFN